MTPPESLQMKVQIQRRPEALNHRHRATQRVFDPLSASAAALPGKKGAQEQPQRQANVLGPPGQ